MLLRSFIVSSIVIITVVESSSLDCSKLTSSRSPTLKVKKHILCNYDRETRPVLDKKRPTNVTVRMVLKGIESSMGRESGASMVFWMAFRWKDELLTWDPQEYDGVDSVHISSSEIWIPDVQQYKDFSEKSKIKVLEGTDCLVQKTGSVSCIAEGYDTAKCIADIHAWPYDTMNCTLKYTSGIYNTSEMRLFFAAKAGLTLSGYTESAAWKLIDTKSRKRSFDMEDQTFHSLFFDFTLQRHNAMITSTMFIPAFALITMSLVPLLLQAGNAERLCLVAANILTHLLFIQYTQFMVSSADSSMPTAVLFFRDSLAISVLVLVELTLIKVLMSNRGPSPSWLMRPCKFVTSGVFGRILLTEEPQEVRDEENGTQIDQKQVTITKLIAEKSLIVSVCDKLCFIILFIVYFCMVFRMLPI